MREAYPQRAVTALFFPGDRRAGEGDNKAVELKIPVTKDNLKIVRSHEMITVEAHYEITIDFFNGAYKYVWKFDPIVQRPLFAV